MVFCGFRILYRLAEKFMFVFIRAVFMFWIEFMCYCIKNFEEKKRKYNLSLSSIPSSCRNPYDVRFCAVFTIEAAFVLGIVFMSIALLIQYAYTEYDKVTGTMILEEMLIRARRETDDSESYFEDMGEQLGNPRLWFDEYKVDISIEKDKVSGEASSGEWEKEIELDIFRPGTYLRQREFLEEVLKDGEEHEDGEYRVQAGNEPELYGDLSGNGME